jgi:micrococcal nuclease
MESINSEQYSKLLESPKDLEMFTLEGRTLLAKVVDVYDGDTCKVNIFLFENVLKKFTVRMMGYDTPEMRTKNLVEKKYGIRSKTILSNLVLNKIVKLECLEFDKYGRILGNIISKDKNNNDIHINNFMIENHLGYGYLGDTKKKFDDLMTGGYYSELEIKVPETIHYPI